MAKAVIYKFLITDQQGDKKIEVVSDTLQSAIEAVRSLSTKENPPLRIDLIEKNPTPYQLLGTE